MEITTTWTAIRKDRGLTAAHRGAGLTCATKPGTNGVSPMTPFVSVPAYVADQESHPPREWCV